MNNMFLKPIYKEVYGKAFSYSDFNNRLQMQKMVYLLQELGVDVGRYNFSWYKHGPFSQTLLDDMYCAVSTTDTEFTPDTENAINKLRELFSYNQAIYPKHQWVECVASLYYLDKNFWKIEDEEELLTTLKSKKAHLSDEDTNKEALKMIQKVFY